jgi:hypothetical protein
MRSVVIVGPIVTSVKPETIPALAEIRAEPTATPVTTPVLLTVAIDWSEEDHSNVTPVNWEPVWSNATAVSCAVRPTAMFAPGLATVTNATVVLGPLALPPQDRPAATNR